MFSAPVSSLYFMHVNMYLWVIIKIESRSYDKPVAIVTTFFAVEQQSNNV